MLCELGRSLLSTACQPGRAQRSLLSNCATYAIPSQPHPCAPFCPRQVPQRSLGSRDRTLVLLVPPAGISTVPMAPLDPTPMPMVPPQVSGRSLFRPADRVPRLAAAGWAQQRHLGQQTGGARNL
jgi:hypothetical protein